MGTAYLLAVPFTILVCFIYEAYERQYMYTLVSQMIMFGANATMFYLLSSPKSTYRKASTDDAGLPQILSIISSSISLPVFYLSCDEQVTIGKV